jgi:hypothetical protein
MTEINDKKPVATPAIEPERDTGGSLVAMLIAGLVLIILGYIGIMLFV